MENLPVPVDHPQGSKTYSQMTEAERWAWHTDVYAFRRVYLGIYDTISPCDDDGRWFDVGLVNAAEIRKREKQKEAPTTKFKDREAFARAAGFSSWLEREDAIARQKEREQRGLAWQAENAAAMRAGALRQVGAAARLGVTAREWTPDEMDRARAELGLTDSPPESPP